MTVKELKEKLDQMPENLIVMICMSEVYEFTEAMNVSRGVNELDGCVFIDDYVEGSE